MGMVRTETFSLLKKPLPCLVIHFSFLCRTAHSSHYLHILYTVFSVVGKRNRCLTYSTFKLMKPRDETKKYTSEGMTRSDANQIISNNFIPHAGYRNNSHKSDSNDLSYFYGKLEVYNRTIFTSFRIMRDFGRKKRSSQIVNLYIGVITLRGSWKIKIQENGSNFAHKDE